MRIFKYVDFNRWAKDLKLDDALLLKAARELEEGLYDASLGSGIYKKRVAIGGRGKRGGARTIVAFKSGDISVFIYGYAKNEKSNVTEKEKEALKKLAKMYFQYNENQLDEAVKNGELLEVTL